MEYGNGCIRLWAPREAAVSSAAHRLFNDRLVGPAYNGKQKLMEAHGDTHAGSVSPLRGSDPSITQTIYELTAPGTGSILTLTDPIGVYMDDVDISGWAAPDGTPLKYEDVVTLSRGEKGAAVRYSFEIPQGAGYKLGECTVGGQRVHFGGQLVKHAIPCYLKVSTYRAPVTALPTKLPPPKALLQPLGGERANAVVNDTRAAAAMAVGAGGGEEEAASHATGGGGAGRMASSRLFGC